MNPLVPLLAIGAVMALSNKKSSPVYEGGTRMTLEPGTYRVKMAVAPFATSTQLSSVFVMPHMTLVGLGGAAYFESLTIDPKNAAGNWTMTALFQYGGAAKTIDLLPGMSFERVS